MLANLAGDVGGVSRDLAKGEGPGPGQAARNAVVAAGAGKMLTLPRSAGGGAAGRHQEVANQASCFLDNKNVAQERRTYVNGM